MDPASEVHRSDRRAGIDNGAHHIGPDHHQHHIDDLTDLDNDRRGKHHHCSLGYHHRGAVDDRCFDAGIDAIGRPSLRGRLVVGGQGFR